MQSATEKQTKKKTSVLRPNCSQSRLKMSRERMGNKDRSSNTQVGSTRAQRRRADNCRDVGVSGIKFNYSIATKQQTIREL